jgi:RNA polymerase sigma factor (sigma-70 family)
MLFSRLKFLSAPGTAIESRAGSHTVNEAVALGQERWASLLRRIREENDGAMDDLYREFSRGLTHYFLRHRVDPQELGDRMQETFVSLLEAIQHDRLREPGSLPGFLMTIARRQVADYIGHVSRQRREFVDTDEALSMPDPAASPDQLASTSHQVQLMREMLEQLDATDRELLEGFYIRAESREVICKRLGITGDQFRLSKSRAKAKFVALAERSLPRRAFAHFWADNRRLAKKSCGGLKIV